MTNVSGKVRAAILESYPRYKWRTAFEIRLPKAGESHPLRIVDAISIGRKYPEVHGFEVKVSRADLLSELADPEKAKAAMQYVNFWWLVVGSEEVIDGITVPPEWGILAVKEGRLVLIRAASALHQGARWSGSMKGRFVLSFLDAYEARGTEKREELNLP